jgi:anthranilate phosphoribosyltransferase
MPVLEELANVLLARQSLDAAAAGRAASALLDDAVSTDSKAAFLRALAQKGETADEITVFVREFLGHAICPPLDLAGLGRPAIDVCGTGADRLGLFNVSTTSMFIVAACGAAVVKHGNRGVTSQSGSADVLEALGLRIDLPPASFAECVRGTGLGFMLAPNYHPAFKAIAPVRKVLAAEGTRTIFNIIGPLLNPMQPPFQLAGVFDPALVATYAKIFQQLGRVRAWAVHGMTPAGQGMDELSTLAPTHIAKAEGGAIIEETVSRPAWIPSPISLDQLAGGDSRLNAEILEGLLRGEVRGPKRDLAVFNAAAALVIAGLARDLESGCARAEEAIDSGSAFARLEAWRAFAG